MRSQELEIDGRAGKPPAHIDVPETVTGYVLLVHGFSHGPDPASAADLGRALVRLGWAVVRVAFAGPGGSGGHPAEETISSGDVDDIVRVADHMRSAFAAPALLVGHSLGGAAALAAASRIPEARAVVTVGAPFPPDHLTGDPVAPVLIVHDPDDEAVPFDHAVRIREAVGPRAALIPIEGGHFLPRPDDRRRVADLVSVWATPFVTGGSEDRSVRDGEEEPAQGTVVVRESGTGRLAQTVRAPGLVWSADEPDPSGEPGVGPDPYQLLLSALGACTTMTVRLYADRKGWPLDRTTVTLTHDRMHAVDCAECLTREGRIDRIVREIRFDGDLDAAQRERLLQIAERCPVHRTLTSEIVIETDEV